MKLKAILLLVFMICAGTVRAQDDEVSFTAGLSKNTLGLNERLRVDFTMNKDGDNFEPPGFEGFRVLMGPNQSISNSWINGKRTYSKTYSYILSPLQQGNFTIGQAKVEIDGQDYKTAPLKVSVTAAVDRPNEEPTADEIADNSLHLVAEVSNATPYLNEALNVVYKLYVSPEVSVSNFVILDDPKHNNFWSEDIEVKRWDVETGLYQGKQYRYVVLRKVVLYPQKSGALEIEPLNVDITVDIPTNKRDFFGQRIFKQAHKTISSGVKSIRVKELPENGRPDDFTGAVGQFQMDLITSKNSLKANESLTARLTISGNGNLKLFELPEVKFPSSLEVYEPEYEEQITTTLSGMRGKVTHSYTLVPQFKGKYPIPATSFSYFDPQQGVYKTISTLPAQIDVFEGPVSNLGSEREVTAVPSGRKPVEGDSDYFRYIKLKSDWRSLHEVAFFGSPLYLSLIVAPVLLIPVVLLISRKRREAAADLEGLKVRKASKLARKYLSDARKNMGDQKQFYAALEKALHNYLKAKIKIETSEFSKDRINDLLANHRVDELNASAFISLLGKCELARYTPLNMEGMEKDYQIAVEVLEALDKQIR